MTLQQLRYLVEIEKSASFSEAAKRLFVSQPSLSTAIKDLEKELGIRIFTRSHHGIRLTSDGRSLLLYAKQMLAQEEKIKNRFLGQSESTSFVFSISSQHYVFVMESFAKLVNQYKEIPYSLHLREVSTAEVIEDVRSNKSEIGIIAISENIYQPLNRALKKHGLLATELFSTPMHVFLGRQHPLAKQEKLDLEELAGYPCIIFDQNENSEYHFSEETLLPTTNPRQQIFITDKSTSVYLQENCQAYNPGTGITQSSTSEVIAALPLQGQPYIHICWIARKSQQLSEAAKSFLDYVQKAVEKYGKTTLSSDSN
ncbi:MAG: LysR family transcriptional regulator [Erysipelotrichaceae bacterium]|jgi:DNA-binding transcriptional LysR family regulator|nr:LysR family transcriptional regulator [Erysipelotrichaceae bacterium]